LQPFNPAVKGQEYQEVQTALKLLESIQTLGGVQGQALPDVAKTFENIKEKLGDKLVVFHDPEAMAAMVQQLIPQTNVNTTNLGSPRVQ
jgi:hypothetical protein